VKRNDGDGRFYLNNKPVFLNGAQLLRMR
jgi:hypothetical protein